ncbi:MAG: cadmium-translocating P-type ATPase [Verrucomicrobia bacterium]|nr:cadmium-translocating P-type ATPase [Verrucomicrobiota bacterium]MBS0636686.1 cadmium-translocating P-type ATPase [Verrucomicrobiota bacterium]
MKVPIGKRRSQEFQVRDFFEMGLEESASPFLTPFARRISHNFPLKASIVASILLACSFFVTSPLSEILLTAVYFIVGVPALINAIEDIVLKHDCNIDVLMTLAAFSAIFMGSGFEGALLLVLFALSGAIEDAVSLKAKNALMQLHKIVPAKAYVLEDGELRERAIQDVALDAQVLVRAGEVVPLDGVVIEGASQVSLVHLTGESLPVRKIVGDEIPAGANVVDGSLTVKVTRLSQDSTVSRIIQLITEAQNAKPALERWFDTFGRRYALTIISLFVFFALSFPYLLGIDFLGKEGSIYRSLAFLITASPCALILAVPIAYLSALGACARKGIVLKGGIVLDALERCKVVAFDKTGTLTLGELTLDTVLDPELLAIAASLERNAVHPIAKAIVKSYQGPYLPVSDVRVIPGYGVEGTIEGKYVYIGDPSTKLSQEELEHAKKAGNIMACLVVGSKTHLLFFSDKARPGIKRMLDALKKSGRELIMLTGDHRESAQAIAREIGLDRFEAELKPEDKLQRITALSEAEGLAMVGDGINDAPALARATVGICMGQVGSATARGAADVILLHDNIELLDWLFTKASQTRHIVIQNLTIALIAIICGVIPALAGVLPLWLAVIVHEGGTVLVGLNALRLLK